MVWWDWVGTLFALAAAFILPMSGLAWEKRTVRRAEMLSAQGANLTPELKAIAQGDVGTGKGKSHPMGELTRRDRALGKRCVRFSGIVSAAALICSIAISWYLLATVPWNTRLEVGGRTSGSVSAPFFMLLCVLMHLQFVWRSRKEKTDLRPKARFYGYILLPVMTVVFLYGQWWVAGRYLVAAGIAG
ncbi:hypothetical protein ACFFON_06360 [Arthrobacter citreus]|uniref:hypothetical protein n=1 Tax=Arthrobacter TaxID=1663 RepID=UPI001264C03B|nr:hypothetical protein [Arthrobacter gandavensis]